MSVEEREIKALTPWSSVTMACLCLAGVKFKLELGPNTHVWHARWTVEGETSALARNLRDTDLWILVHHVALAFGRTGKRDY